MSHDKFLFCHVPKTGGMALRYYLLNQFSNDQVCPYTDWRQLAAADPREVSQFNLFQGHFHLDLARFLPPVRAIAFFREPVARTISLLRHMRRDLGFHSLHHSAAGKSLDEMLDDPHIRNQLFNHQTSYLSGHLKMEGKGAAFSKSKNFPADIGELLTDSDIDIALGELEKLAFVGLTESMDESLRRMCTLFGFHPAANFARRNEIPFVEKADDEERLSESTIQRIRDLNNLDIPLYGAAQALFFAQSGARPYEELVRRSFASRKRFWDEHSGELNLGGFMPGSNWYEAEQDGSNGKFYRWAGPLGTSTIEWPTSSDSGRRLVLTLFPFQGDDLAQSLRVSCDGAPVERGRLLPDGYVEYECALGDSVHALSHGFHQIKFEYEMKRNTVLASGDVRQLAFGLSEVRLQQR